MLVALLLPAASLGGPRDYLFRDERLCSQEGDFCFSGTMSFQRNPRLLQLRARVQTAPGPGLLRIWVTGENRLGHRRYAPFELRVRGNPTEILNHKMIPDPPDALGWEVDFIEFVADAD